MIIIAFISVIVIVIDRIIYIKQSRHSFSNEFFYYNKNNGEKLSEEKFMNIPEVEHSEYIKIYFQKEDLNLPLISKYILHLFVIIITHFLVFWYLPITGNLNLNNNKACPKGTSNNCNDFLENNYIIFFYILFIFYYIFSALQIQHGLLDTRKKSVLMRGDNLFNLIIFKTYKLIPFVYELKLTIDWTISPTALDLFKWIKFESVYDLLFSTHCTMIQEKFRDIGEKIGIIEKLSFGCIGFSGLLILLLGPLFLFSTLNPSNTINSVTGAHIKMSLCFKKDSKINNFTIFKNDNPFELTNIGIYYFYT